VSKHLRLPDIALTRYPSAYRASLWVWASPLLRRLAEVVRRPNRVRHPTDWSFTSCCSPPRVTTAQLQSVTSRRAYAWRGLSPLWSCALSGAHRGRENRLSSVPPPSEPDVRISRIRLSDWWFT